MIGLAVAAFAGSLLGSPHCVGMCGPFAVACGGGARSATQWHLGRLTTYTVLGGAAGGIGATLSFNSAVATTVAVLLVVGFSAALAGLLPEPRVGLPGVKRLAAWALHRHGGWARYAFGLANGLLPCGLVYAALGLAVAGGTPLGGAVIMFAFGLGTVPLLTAAAVGLRTMTDSEPGRRRLVAAFVLVTGLVAIGLRTL